MALRAPARPTYTKTNKNELSIDSGDNIDSGRIDDKIANLSSSIKKMSSGVGFLISKASLAFL